LDTHELIRGDFSHPAYAAVAAFRAAASAPDPRAELSRRADVLGVATESGHAVRFVAAEDAPAGRAYETHIAATGRVPTRLNAHDLFNAMVWLALPQTKAQLNALQSGAIERHGVSGRRGSLRDALTLFDESGALLVTEDTTLPALLGEHRWREAFVECRTDWTAVRLFCFGHALLEKLAAPYKAITAHVLVVERSPRASLSEVDGATARMIDTSFTTASLHPVPVLGVPGWCDGNDDASFYDDGAVFRPARASPGRDRGQALDSSTGRPARRDASH
jgi:hypothetical protein